MSESKKRGPGRPKLPVTKNDWELHQRAFLDLQARVEALEARSERKDRGLSDAEFAHVFLAILAGSNGLKMPNLKQACDFARHAIQMREAILDAITEQSAAL